MTSNRRTQRSWTIGRIVALLAIAVAVAGLAHISSGHPAGWAAVPDGAHAGQLKLKPCTYPTEKGDVPADCGTLVVPENRADPKSRLIAVPVTRIRSRSANPAEPIFRLEGGPGRSNMEFPFASRYIDNHDLVLVGYRGVDGSARLDCPEVASARRNTADLLSAGALRASTRAMRSCAERLKADGYDLAGYTLPQRVDDLDAARSALGYQRVDLLSESFGTRVALIYGWRHPQSVHRSVMIGANPPGHFVYDPAQTDAQLRRFAALGAGGAVASMRHTAAHLPEALGPVPDPPRQPRDRLLLRPDRRLLRRGADLRPHDPRRLARRRQGRRGRPVVRVVRQRAAVPARPGLGRHRRDGAHRRRRGGAALRSRRRVGPGRPRQPVPVGRWRPGSRLAGRPGGGRLRAPARLRRRDAGDQRDARRRDAGRERDPRADAAPAQRPPGPAVRFGHTTDFWNDQVGAGNRLINHYLDTGQVDASRYVPQKVDFTPPLRQGTLARGLVGAMAGWPRHAAVAGVDGGARAHAGPARPPGAGRRALGWAPVLGLGGWFAAALFVLIALPSVPVDATLVLVLGTAVPVALAGYWAWRDPSRVAPRAAGFAAAAGGALVGAGIGFTCGTAMAAIATTLIGAVAGMNLALIACDVVAETRRRRRAPAPQAAELPRERVAV